jgi:hypothetical protein
MSASQLPLALAQRHHNRQLFADRYLDETLPRRNTWLDLVDAAAPVLAQVRALFDAFTPSSNEAQTEHELVRPVLAALGHTFEIQAALRTPKGTKKPDYLFYRDLTALNANKGRVLTDADLGAALAVGDAKYWERKLDVSSQGESDEITKVPADQIAFYMRHTGVPWGILTNGRRWRLYHQETVEKQDRFYEVDLKDLADANDPEAFLYFFAFFRRAAFAPALGEALTLDGMLRESVDYARGVSESLKAQVFDALRHIAQGFLDYPRNRLEPTPETLREIYGSSLIVLYRLLFVLYAEARELLPLRESPTYRDQYSLYGLVRDVSRCLDSGATLLTDTGQTWARLSDLFGIINVGPATAGSDLQWRAVRPTAPQLPRPLQRGRRPTPARPRQAGPRGQPADRPARVHRLPRPGRAPPGHDLRGPARISPGADRAHARRLHHRDRQRQG